jgi:ABC-type phosphate/phosphonate transport system permease subunit
MSAPEVTPMQAHIAPKAPPKKRDWSWRSQAFRGLLYQILAIVAIVAAVWWLATNAQENMRVRGIKSGFDFLSQPAGFDIGEELVNYESSNPYWRAFWAGIVNTLRVAVIGIVLTTILGTLIGVGRFSRNGLVRGICFAIAHVVSALYRALARSGRAHASGQCVHQQSRLNVPNPAVGAGLFVGHHRHGAGLYCGVYLSWFRAQEI